MTRHAVRRSVVNQILAEGSKARGADMSLRDYVHCQSVTVKYSDDDMRCYIFYNGRQTDIYAVRDHYDDPFRVYVEGRTSSPIFVETKGWGVVGGISMILDAITDITQ